MGEVISITRVSDVDIFSQFDAQCPGIPEEINTRIPRSARKAVMKTPYQTGEHNFRNHCAVVVVLSLAVLIAVKFATGAITQQAGYSPLQISLQNTAFRESQATWLAHIQSLENSAGYQQLLEEKRLYALQHQQAELQ